MKAETLISIELFGYKVLVHPFAELLGIELVNLGHGEAVCQIEIAEKHRRAGGMIHGGVTASLIDAATGYATYSVLGEGENTVTIDFTTHLIRPLNQGLITAKAKVIHAGRKILTVNADVFDESGKLSATSVSSYIRLKD